MGRIEVTGELVAHWPAAGFVLHDEQVAEARREETRERRAGRRAIEMIRAGRTRR